MQNQKNKITLYYVLYVIGLASGLALVVFSTWADLESTFYGFFHRTNTRFDGLTCPILMTPHETSSFSVKVTNTAERNLSPSIKTDISTRGAPFSVIERLSLAPGESTVVTWEIGPENIDISRFVFAQVYVYSFYPIPDSENTCGVFVVNLPGNGILITWGMVGLSILGMGYGLYGLRQARHHALGGTGNIWYSLVFLSLTIAAGIITCFLGWWIQGILILIVVILLLVIIAGLFVSHSHSGHLHSS